METSLRAIGPEQGRAAILAVSNLPEITGEYREFAELVRVATGDVPRMTAAIHAGVSHDTIARMWRGERVGRAVVIQFSQGYKINPNPLLAALKYQQVDVNNWLNTTDAEIEQTRDAEEREILRYFRGVPPELRGTVVDAVKGYKTAADLLQRPTRLSRESNRDHAEKVAAFLDSDDADLGELGEDA